MEFEFDWMLASPAIGAVPGAYSSSVLAQSRPTEFFFRPCDLSAEALFCNHLRLRWLRLSVCTDRKNRKISSKKFKPGKEKQYSMPEILLF